MVIVNVLVCAHAVLAPLTLGAAGIFASIFVVSAFDTELVFPLFDTLLTNIYLSPFVVIVWVFALVVKFFQLPPVRLLLLVDS